jgi:hypothetical protein
MALIALNRRWMRQPGLPEKTSAVTGLGVGVLQALVLMRHGVAGAFWWALANPPARALGWLVTSYVITANVKEQLAVFGGSGALVFGLLTRVAPRSAVPGDGSQGRGKAGRTRSVTKGAGAGRLVATQPDAERQGGRLAALSRGCAAPGRWKGDGANRGN